MCTGFALAAAAWTEHSVQPATSDKALPPGSWAEKTFPSLLLACAGLIKLQLVVLHAPPVSDRPLQADTLSRFSFCSQKALKTNTFNNRTASCSKGETMCKFKFMDCTPAAARQIDYIINYIYKYINYKWQHFLSQGCTSEREMRTKANISGYSFWRFH